MRIPEHETPTYFEKLPEEGRKEGKSFLDTLKRATKKLINATLDAMAKLPRASKTNKTEITAK